MSVYLINVDILEGRHPDCGGPAQYDDPIGRFKKGCKEHDQHHEINMRNPA